MNQLKLQDGIVVSPLDLLRPAVQALRVYAVGTGRDADKAHPRPSANLQAVQMLTDHNLDLLDRGRGSRQVDGPDDVVELGLGHRLHAGGLVQVVFAVPRLSRNHVRLLAFCHVHSPLLEDDELFELLLLLVLIELRLLLELELLEALEALDVLMLDHELELLLLELLELSLWLLAELFSELELLLLTELLELLEDELLLALDRLLVLIDEFDELDELVEMLDRLELLELDRLETLELLLLELPELLLLLDWLDTLDELEELELLSELAELELWLLWLLSLELLVLLEELEFEELEALDQLLLDFDELVEIELEELELLLVLLLDGLLELEEKSSIDRIWSRSPDRGPGNWSEPVWKLRMSGSLTGPLVRVSTSLACHMVFSASVTRRVSVSPGSTTS